MRRILGITVLMLFATVVVLADDHDDHNDKAPVQAGYVVVTPTSGGAGLVAFETFGMRENGANGGASQAGVMPAGLTTSAMIFVESSGRLSKNLAIAIVNPYSFDVSVAMTLRKSDGTQVATMNLTVPLHRQISKFVTELFANQSSVPSDFTGTLVLTSSPLPVAMIGLRFRGSNFSTLPVTSLSGVSSALPVISIGIGGPGAILLPQFASGGKWATEVVLVNTGTSSVTVRVDLFKSDGTLLASTLNGQNASSFTNLTIPVGGVVILAPRDRDGDDDF